MLEQRIDTDLKKFLLDGDKKRAEVLRGIKSALLYEKIKSRSRDEASDELVLSVLAKEAKKRTDAIEIYNKAGAMDRVAAEQYEKDVISEYLPRQLADEEIEVIVAQIAAESSDKNMGRIIGLVKDKVGASAEAGRIVAIVKQYLSKG